jgi:serine/threonine protein kinase
VLPPFISLLLFLTLALANLVDVWSAGCLVFALFFGSELFTADNDVTQVIRVAEFVGTANKTFERLVPIAPIQWESVLPKSMAEVADLLTHMVQPDPQRRFTVKQCLQRPLFRDLRNSNEMK